MSAMRSTWILGAMAIAAGACSETTTMTPPMGITGQLDIELRDKIDVQLIPIAESKDAIDVKLTLASGGGYGVLSVGQTISAKGRRRALPEAETEMYTATFRVPAAEAERAGLLLERGLRQMEEEDALGATRLFRDASNQALAAAWNDQIDRLIHA